VELTKAPRGHIETQLRHNTMSTNKKGPATGQTFAKGVTASTVIDSVKAYGDNVKKTFESEFEMGRQLGHVHKFAEANKKATGRTISDHLQPIANACGVSLKTLQNRAKEGRKLVDSRLTIAKARKVYGELSKPESQQKASLRNVIAAHMGTKVEAKTQAKDETKPDPKAGDVRTLPAVKVKGSDKPATANLSDDGHTAALEWLQIGVQAAKATNVEWAEWLKIAGLQSIPAKVKA